MSEIDEILDHYRELVDKNSSTYGELEMVKQEIRESIANDESLTYEQKNELLLSIGQRRLPKEDTEYVDTFTLLQDLHKVLEGNHPKDVLVGTNLKNSKHNYDSGALSCLISAVMDDISYHGVLRLLGLPKSTNLLGKCRSPYTVMLRAYKIWCFYTSPDKKQQEIDELLKKSKEYQKNLLIYYLKDKFNQKKVEDGFNTEYTSKQKVLDIKSSGLNIDEDVICEVLNISKNYLRRC